MVLVRQLGDSVMKLFLSYSHKDKVALQTLHMHLGLLIRERLVETWYDRDILAGGDIDAEVRTELESSECFIALVSPDYIASNYCYEQEMTRALERRAAGEMLVVPVIIRPCLWQETPLSKLKALPEDGKAIAEWTNEDRAYTNVVEELLKLIKGHGKTAATAKESPTPSVDSLSRPARRYRVHTEFDEVDKANFKAECFRTISSFIEMEINGVNQDPKLKGVFARMGYDGFSCTVVNTAAKQTAHLTIYMGGGHGALGDIYYSTSAHAARNTANGWMTIESDGFELYLEHNNMGAFDHEERTTPETAANYLWENVLNRAGVEHAR
jgi:hypothetical protein